MDAGILVNGRRVPAFLVVAQNHVESNNFLAFVTLFCYPWNRSHELFQEAVPMQPRRVDPRKDRGKDAVAAGPAARGEGKPAV